MLIPYSHLAVGGASFLLGCALFWQVGSWRLDAEQLKVAQKDNTVLTQSLVDKQAQIEAWMKQVKEDTDKVANIIHEQESAREEAAKQTNLLAEQVAGLKNVAKTLTPTGIKLGTAQQQLLKAISSAANNSVTRTSENSGPKGSPTEYSTFPQLADRRFR